MQSREKGAGIPAELVKNKKAIADLAASNEARELIRMLGGVGGVGTAARAAAGGDANALRSMVEAIMHTEKGAQLAQRLEEQARRAGLE